MGIVTTVPQRIGDREVPPGYFLTPEDMVGRNIMRMKELELVRFVEEDGPRRGPGRPRKIDTESE